MISVGSGWFLRASAGLTDAPISGDGDLRVAPDIWFATDWHAMSMPTKTVALTREAFSVEERGRKAFSLLIYSCDRFYRLGSS